MTSIGQQLLVPGRGQSGLPVKNGLVAWYNADKITGVANGGAVASWLDSSGNGNTASQGTTANQPTLTKSWRNGKAAVTFDGVNDFLQATTVNVPQPATVYVACQMLGSLVAPYVFNGVTSRLAIRSQTGPVWQLIALTSISGGVSDNNPHILRGFYNNNLTSQLWVDGTSVASGDAAANSGLVGLNIAADIGSAPVQNFCNIAIAQLVFYNRALTSAEQIALDHYFSTYYGITVSD